MCRSPASTGQRMDPLGKLDPEPVHKKRKLNTFPRRLTACQHASCSCLPVRRVAATERLPASVSAYAGRALRCCANKSQCRFNSPKVLHRTSWLRRRNARRSSAGGVQGSAPAARGESEADTAGKASHGLPGSAYPRRRPAPDALLGTRWEHPLDCRPARGAGAVLARRNTPRQGHSLHIWHAQEWFDRRRAAGSDSAKQRAATCAEASDMRTLWVRAELGRCLMLASVSAAVRRPDHARSAAASQLPAISFLKHATAARPPRRTCGGCSWPRLGAWGSSDEK